MVVFWLLMAHTYREQNSHTPKDELKYTQELKIKGKKYYIIDFNKLSKKPLKKVVSSANAKRLSESEIEKIVRFGLNNNDL